MKSSSVMTTLRSGRKARHRGHRSKAGVSKTSHDAPRRRPGRKTRSHRSHPPATEQPATGPSGVARDTRAHVDRELGRGRSGVVYCSRDASGQDIARKVFGASGLSKVVQYALLGAPNPYLWCEAAIEAAVMRRRILAELVGYWFGTKLRVARAHEYRWNVEKHAYEMHCELIHGRHVALQHPYTEPEDDELADVYRGVMRPLQKRLDESGFDGLVWQAGRGNPVAVNNFMRDGSDGDGGHSWVWIDLESGVPALFPMNPIELVRYYVPKSLRHRGPLFDDVDVTKLRRYVSEHHQGLTAAIGGDRLERMQADIDTLDVRQREWKSLSRHQCSVTYRHVTGSLTDEQAAWYLRHPVRWYSREAVRGVRRSVNALGTLLPTIFAVIRRIQLGKIMKQTWAALRSQKFRARMARAYVASRLSAWQRRGHLSEPHADELRNHLQGEEAATYLTDFGVQLAIKPFVKLVQWWIIPALWMAGAIGDVTLGVALLAAGPCARTMYTLIRMVQNTLLGRERPWVALWVGVAPVVGNLAYPLQILVSGANEEGAVARFILFDTFGKFGQWFPIWGGQDSGVEHWFNRCPHTMIRMLRVDPLVWRSERLPDGAVA